MSQSQSQISPQLNNISFMTVGSGGGPQGMSGGAVAAMALAMLVVGAMVGAVVATWLDERSRRKQAMWFDPSIRDTEVESLRGKRGHGDAGDSV